MAVNESINKKVEATLASVDAIETVNVSPFFKEKVMHKIKNMPNKGSLIVWAWFTPKLQLATLVCIIILNAIVLNTIIKENYETSVNTLAETYGWSTTSESILLN